MPPKQSKTATTSPKTDSMVSAQVELLNFIDVWFKRGGYPLVAIGLGAILTIFYALTQIYASSNTGELLSGLNLCFYLGTLLLLGGFATAIVAAVSARKNLKLGIQRYEKTIQTAQEFSKESVQAIRNLNELLAVHVDTVAQVLDAAKPILSMFGGSSFANSQYLGSDLTAFSNSAQKVIENVEQAITEADFNALVQYRAEVSKLATKTRDIVKNFKDGAFASEQVADFTQSIQSARDAASAYSDSATKIFARVSTTTAPVIGMLQLARHIPVVGAWLQDKGIGGHIEALEGLQKLMHGAQDANLAVHKAIQSPNKETLDNALQQMQMLRVALVS